MGYTNFIDHSIFGDKTFHYHPYGLPSADSIPSLGDLDNPDSKFSYASHHFAAVVNHASWIRLYRNIRSFEGTHCNLKRAAFFISTCQTAAGSFLSCLPSTAHQPTDLARTAFQRRFRIRLNPPPPPEWNDPFGDDTVNKGQHTTRHIDTNEVWELAMSYTFGKQNLIVDPRKQNGPVEWSPGHIPDLSAMNKAPGGFHIVADTKVGNVMATTYDTVGTMAANIERAASIAFAASGEHYASLVHGRTKIETRRTPNNLNS